MNAKKEYVMAIDVAKGKSMFYILSIHGEVILDAIEYEHNLNNFKLVELKIREGRTKQDLAVFMESTSIYHYPVMRYFLEQGYEVIVVNPNLVKKSSTTFRKTKTDRLDCIKIAETYFKEKIKSNAIKVDDIYNNLMNLNRQYLSLEKSLTALKNRYVRLLDVCIPEHEEFYKNIKGKVNRRMKYQEKYLNLYYYLPHSEYLQKTRIDRIANVLNLAFDRNYHERLKREAIKLKTISKNSYPGVTKLSYEVENLQQIIRIIKNLMKEQDIVKTKLITLGKQAKEFPHINSIIGIGELTTAQIIAELGDISRFRNYKQINAYCGLEPSIYQSGKAYYNGRITKSGNGYARKVLYTTIITIVSYSSHHCETHPVYVYYSKQKENKSTKASVIPTSTKLIRIIFSLCKNKTYFTL